jgi:hypothetical protein
MDQTGKAAGKGQLEMVNLLCPDLSVVSIVGDRKDNRKVRWHGEVVYCDQWLWLLWHWRTIGGFINSTPSKYKAAAFSNLTRK